MVVPREPILHFPGCIRTSSRNCEAADRDVFFRDIYKRQQQVKFRMVWSELFLLRDVGFVITQMECQHTYTQLKKHENWTKALSQMEHFMRTFGLVDLQWPPRAHVR